ncbi:MAG: C-GCAxxG-C-C family protein [Acidaminococcus sp.]|uniref:C-GCAxxG-C-C family protein n=1 Tax=Acidaminococcus sp. TaxID=1872103 RepID=UPI003F1751A6
MSEETLDRAEKAVEYKHAKVHNNCAQSVLLAFQDKLGKSTEELRALGDSFGLGMGGMEATCGALTGAAMVVGLLNHSDKPSKQIMNTILHEFRDQAGATLCKDLKGRDTGKMLCPCDDCIRIAVRELEKHLA